MEIINVLITGAGAPGIAGTIKCLRENPEQQKFLIHTCDIDADPVGKYLSDHFIQIPPPENPEYISNILFYTLTNKIQLIIPQTTREIEVLSKHKKELEANDIKVLVSDHESIIESSDKHKLLKICKEIGVPFPNFEVVDNRADLKNAILKMGYPKNKVIVKPSQSNGMRGVRLIDAEPFTQEKYYNEKPSGLEITLEGFMSIFKEPTFPELIVSEYLPGIEYSVDVLNIFNEKIIIPRKRLKIRSGISFETISDLENKAIIEFTRLLTERLNLKYCFGFQFKLDENGLPKILECNPRIQGTMEASASAGCNMIFYSCMYALNKIDVFPKFNLKDKLVFKRFWGGLATN